MADSKLADLTEATTVASDDIFYTVADPGGTPTDKKVTKANLLKDEVKGPATNTDGKVPQWDGANSKLLKDGLTVGTGASNLVQLDGSSRLPAIDGSQLSALPSTVVLKSLFDANSILAANSDDTPAALTVAEQRIVGRITGGSIGALTAAQLLGILLASTVAGDLPYYSDTNVLARLPKGAANTHLLMNAGATAPEYANPIKLVNFSRDTATASGTQAITGVGFKPNYVIFFVSYFGGASSTVGFDNGTDHTQIYYLGSFVVAYGQSILVGSDVGNYNTAYITTIGTDGFTLTWTKTGSPTGTAYGSALCFR